MRQRRAVRLAVQPNVRVAPLRSAGRAGKTPSRTPTQPPANSDAERGLQHALGRALTMPPRAGRWFTPTLAVPARPDPPREDQAAGHNGDSRCGFGHTDLGCPQGRGRRRPRICALKSVHVAGSDTGWLAADRRIGEVSGKHPRSDAGCWVRSRCHPERLGGSLPVVLLALAAVVVERVAPGAGGCPAEQTLCLRRVDA